jgi:predicted RNA binding protein YcfA (HicA-like mRNA interferase family)
MTIFTDLNLLNNSEEPDHQQDKIQGTMGMGRLVSVEVPQEGDLEERVEGVASETIATSQEEIQQAQPAAIKKKKRRNKRKKKTAVKVQVNLPWKMENIESLKFLGYLEVIELDKMPLWLSTIVGDVVSIDTTVCPLVRAELIATALKVLECLKPIPYKQGGLKSYINSFPEAITLILSTLNIYFDSNLASGNNSEHSLRESHENIKTMCLIELSRIDEQLIKYSTEISDKNSNSYVKSPYIRENVMSHLTHLSEVLNGIVEMGTEPLNSPAAIKKLGVNTSHIIRSTDASGSLHDYLTLAKEGYQRLDRLMKHYNQLLTAYVQPDVLKTVGKSIEIMNRKLSKLLDQRNISYENVTSLMKSEFENHQLMRNTFTAILYDISTNGVPPFARVYDLSKLDVGGYKSLQFLPEEQRLGITSNWYKEMVLSMREEHERIVLFLGLVEYSALKSEGYELSSEKFQYFIKEVGQWLIHMRRVIADDNTFEDFRMVNGRGYINFNDLLFYIESEFNCIKEVMIESPGAWLRISCLIRNITGHINNSIPEYFASKAADLKKKVSQLKNKKGEEQQKALAQLLNTISLVDDFLGIFEEHNEKICSLGEDVLTYREKPEELQRELVNKSSKKRKRKKKLAKRATEPSRTEAKQSSEKSEGSGSREADNELVQGKVIEEDVEGDIDEEVLIDKEISIIHEIAERLEDVAQQNTQNIQNRFEKTYQSPFNVTFKELVKELVGAGWRLIKGTKGGHAQFKHPLYRELGRFSVPNHGKNTVLSTGVVKQARERITETS